MEKGRAVLFTGAGFSMSARNIQGEMMPGVEQLKAALWKQCFPDDPYDKETNLQTVYEAALMRNPRATKETLTTGLVEQTN